MCGVGQVTKVLALSRVLVERWGLGVGVSACPCVHPALLGPDRLWLPQPPGLGDEVSPLFTLEWKIFEGQLRKGFMPQNQGTRRNWGGAAGGT